MHKHGTTTTQVFLHADGKPLGCYFQVWSPYYQVSSTVKLESTYSCILKVTGQV